MMRSSTFAMLAGLAISACTVVPANSATPTSLPDIALAQTQTQSVQQAQARLEAARQNYQQAVAELARSLNLDMRAIESNGADLNAILPNFSAEEVRLRQRFGDGDRVGSWPQIRRLSLAWRAQSKPSQRIVAAARARSDAVLFETMVTMRDTGATHGELLALWEEAGALDPRAFQAHMGASRAAMALGDRARAINAAEMALAAAHTPADRAEAIMAKERAGRG